MLFNVESESELWALAECAGRLRKIAPMALRVNPDVAAETHPYISTGLRKHKFGVPIRDARALYAKASGARYLNVRGVSVHIGSQITDVAPFGEAMARVADLVRELREDGHRWTTSMPVADSASTTRSLSHGFSANAEAYARTLAATLARLGCAACCSSPAARSSALRAFCSRPWSTAKKMTASDFWWSMPR